MKQDVLITLRGTQTVDREPPQTVELVTRGTMTGRNGKFAISYVETELTGNKGVVSTFLVFNSKRVVLTREGPMTWVLVPCCWGSTQERSKWT